MNTFVFQPGLTWRKAGFAFFGNSLSYRKVLEANPVWDISKHPSPGSILYKPQDSLSSGSYPATATSEYGSSISPDSYFPFNSYEEYTESLVKYNNKVLTNPDRFNGWSLTSGEVLYGQ